MNPSTPAMFATQEESATAGGQATAQGFTRRYQQCFLSVPRNGHAQEGHLLGDVRFWAPLREADSGEVKHGFRIKRVASTMYKLISQAEGDSDSQKGVETAQAASTAHKVTQAQPEAFSDAVKGKLLIDPQRIAYRAITESDDSPYADASHLHRYPHFSVASNRESTTADTISNLSV